MKSKQWLFVFLFIWAVLSSGATRQAYALTPEDLQMAKNGDIEAMIAAGKAYYEGKDVQKDTKAGAEWLLKGAQLQSQAAFDELFRLANTDDGGEASFAAAQMFSRMYDKLSFHHGPGTNSKLDPEDLRIANLAIKYTARAVELEGDAIIPRITAFAGEKFGPVMAGLGRAYHEGKKIPRDTKTGAGWLLKGAQLQSQAAFDELFRLANTDDGGEACFVVAQHFSKTWEKNMEDMATGWEVADYITRAIKKDGEKILPDIVAYCGETNAAVMTGLGRALYTGEGVQKDRQAGIRWLLQGVELKSQLAFSELLHLADRDDGGEASLVVAGILCEPREPLRYNPEWEYRTGWHTIDPKDPFILTGVIKYATRAIKLEGDPIVPRLVDLCAKTKNGALMTVVGAFYYEDSKNLPQNKMRGVTYLLDAYKSGYKKAEELIRKYASEKNAPEASFVLGEIIAGGGREDAAIEYFQKAFSSNDPEILQRALNIISAQQPAAPILMYLMSEKYLQSSAPEEQKKGVDFLLEAHHKGVSKAASLLLKYAQNGQPDAEYMYGRLMYESVDPSSKQYGNQLRGAAQWFEKAVQHGNQEARKPLDEIHRIQRNIVIRRTIYIGLAVVLIAAVGFYYFKEIRPLARAEEEAERLDALGTAVDRSEPAVPTDVETKRENITAKGEK
ncbi:MAG: hypothetical protein LBR61_09910 [Synergistaceae bacterium]|jgi:TPR repeat protein|nr:hypothetical protein [Synergistaceae bacterium]